MNISAVISLISCGITVAAVFINIGTYKQKLRDLEEKVDKHNNVIERVFRLEENVRHTDIGAMSAELNRAIDDIKELKEWQMNNKTS
mgnify:CR=1 FL=1